MVVFYFKYILRLGFRFNFFFVYLYLRLFQTENDGRSGRDFAGLAVVDQRLKTCLPHGGDRLLIQNLTSLVALRNTELEKLQAAQAVIRHAADTRKAWIDAVGMNGETPASRWRLSSLGTTPASRPATPRSDPRPMYWSVRRELWENRSILVAPLLVMAFVLFATFLATLHAWSTTAGSASVTLVFEDGGTSSRDVALPGVGAASNLFGLEDSDEAWFVFSSCSISVRCFICFAPSRSLATCQGLAGPV